jgi:hypothetical protein
LLSLLSVERNKVNERWRNNVKRNNGSKLKTTI